jgi:hypothetical protein
MKAVLRNLHISFSFPHFLARRQLTWTFAGGFFAQLLKRPIRCASGRRCFRILDFQPRLGPDLYGASSFFETWSSQFASDRDPSQLSLKAALIAILLFRPSHAS